MICSNSGGRVRAAMMVALVALLVGNAQAQYPKSGLYHFIAADGRGAPADWYARFDFAIISTDRETLADSIHAINPNTKVGGSVDWQNGAWLAAPASPPDEWKTFNTAGVAYNIYGASNRYAMNFSDFSGFVGGSRMNDAVVDSMIADYDQSSFDVVVNQGGWYYPRFQSGDIDLDRNGQNDYNEASKGVQWIADEWANGLNSALNTFRGTTGFPLVNNTGRFHSPNDSKDGANLDIDWANHNGFINENNNVISWGSYPTLYNDWMATAPNPHYYLQDTKGNDKEDYQMMRAFLGATMFGDGFASFTTTDAHHYSFYYDEYDVDLGAATTTMQLVKSTGTNQGVYVRFFTKGAVILNVDDAANGVTAAEIAAKSGYAGPYYRFQGGQNWAFNDGSLFQSITLSGGTWGIGDAILLLNSQKTVVADIIIDSDDEGTSPGSNPASMTSGFVQTNANAFQAWCLSYRDGRDAWAMGTKAAGSGTHTATFVPTIGVAGDYEVYEWHGLLTDQTEATDVPYTIQHANGQTTGTINQGANVGQWNLLGTFTFNIGQSGFARITDNANGYVLADAFMFRLVTESEEEPEIGAVTGADGLTYDERRTQFFNSAPTPAAGLTDEELRLWMWAWLSLGIYNSTVSDAIQHYINQYWLETTRSHQGFMIGVALKHGPTLGNGLISQADEDDILARYATWAECGHLFGNFNPNKQIWALVGLYLYCQFYDQSVVLDQYGWSCDGVDNSLQRQQWKDFSWAGRDYEYGDTNVNALQFAKDWLEYHVEAWYVQGNREFDGLNYHLEYTIAMMALSEWAATATLRTKARMSTDLSVYDAVLDYGNSEVGSTLGRTDYKRTDSYLIHVLWEIFGLGEMTETRDQSKVIWACESWRPSNLMVDVGVIADESDSYWHFHKENHGDATLKHDTGKGKWNFVTKYWNLGSNVGQGRQGWQATVRGDGQQKFIRFWINDLQLAPDDKQETNYSGFKGYQYRGSLIELTGKNSYLRVRNGDGQQWDIDEQDSGFRFMKLGKAMFAIRQGNTSSSVEGATEGVDYASYSAFKSAVKANSTLISNSFTNSKGVTITSSTECGVNSPDDCAFPFKRMETVDNVGNHIVDFSSNVMTVQRHGRSATYNFNNFSFTEDDGEAAPSISFIGDRQVTAGELLSFVVTATHATETPSLSASGLPAGATFVDNSDGSGDFSWTPTSQQAGEHQVTFVADVSGVTDSRVVEIQVVAGTASVGQRVKIITVVR